MKLNEFLKLIIDEEARIELEIDEDDPEKDYLYQYFWLSDYRNAKDKYYGDYIVKHISFEPVMENNATISIQIKK